MNERNNIVVGIFLNNFRLYNLVLFMIGYYIKEKKINIRLNNKSWIVFIGLFILNSILEFYIKNQLL